jgi:hypothetical protein
MTATSAPLGLVPQFHPSGLPRPQKFNDAIDTTVTQLIYKGTPVQLTAAGLIVPVTDLDWDALADDIIGVFDGVEYTDSDGRRRVSNHWYGPTTLFNPPDMWVYVWTDPEIVYQAQANGPVPATALGSQFNLASNGGNNTTGLSTAQLLAAPVAAGGQGLFRCVNLDPRIDNAWGDAFTMLQVQIAAHEWVANKLGI